MHCIYNTGDGVLPNIFINNNNPPSTAMDKEFFTQTVRGTTEIIDSDDNWNLLLYKVAYHIKRSAPSPSILLTVLSLFCTFMHILMLMYHPSVFKSQLPVCRLSLKMI